VIALLVALLAGAPPAPGCTKIGCVDQLTIRLRSSRARPPGAMVIELDIDGKTVSCVVPAGVDETRPCDDSVTVTHQEIQRCRGERCRGTGAFEEVMEISATPKRVRVRVKHDERLLGQRSFVSRYARVRPNGRRCPPVCRQAQSTWRL
jgi:hypothetical protein